MSTFISKKLHAFFMLALCCLSFHSGAHWNSAGAYGGTVNAFAVADTNLYVCTNGGIFRSADKRVLTWRVVNTGLTSGTVKALTYINGTSIAGTADQGVFLTTDIGANWTASNTGLSNLSVTALITLGSNVFAGTNGGVFTSTNKGASWSAANTGLSNLSVTCLAGSGNVLFAGTTDGVFVSVNNGAGWTAVNTGFNNAHINSMTVSGTNVFAATNDGVYQANIAAVSWTMTSSGLPLAPVNYITENAGILYAGTSSGVYTSPNTSVQWTSVSNGLISNNVNAVVSFNSKLFAGTVICGIFKSNLNPVSWTETNTGFNALKTSALFASGNLIISATERGLYVCRDVSKSAAYVAANYGLHDSLSITGLAFGGTTLYVTTSTNGVYASADTGRTWALANTGLGTMNVSSIVASGNKLFVGGANGSVYTSAQGAINWSSLSGGLPSGIVIRSFVSDGVNIYLASDQGVYTSTGSGNWMAFNTGLTNLNVLSLALSGTKIFAGTNGGGVFVSNAATAGWAAAGAGLPSAVINSMNAITIGTAQYVTAGLKGAVFATSDNGASWQPFNVQVNLPLFADINGLAFSTLRVYASTPNNSVYSNSKTEFPPAVTTGIFDHAPNGAANGFLLYPNPGNGTFRLSAAVNASAVKSITIFDHSGRLMGQLIPSAEDVFTVSYPKGLYVIQLNTDTAVFSEKLVIE